MSNHLELLREIHELTRANDTWRSATINLIASENVLSPACHRLLENDFHHCPGSRAIASLTVLGR